MRLALPCFLRTTAHGPQSSALFQFTEFQLTEFQFTLFQLTLFQFTEFQFTLLQLTLFHVIGLLPVQRSWFAWMPVFALLVLVPCTAP